MPRDLLEDKPRTMKAAEVKDLFGGDTGGEAAPSRKMTKADFVGDEQDGVMDVVKKSGLPGTNEAIGNMLGLPVDTVNQVLKAVGFGSDEPFGGSTMVKRGMNKLGVNTTPDESTEGKRLAAETGRGLGAGAMFGPGAAIPGAVGGLTGGVAKEAGAGPIGQTVAGMAGGMAAGAAQNMVAKAVSGTPNAKLQAYQQEGVEPRIAIGDGMGNFAARQSAAGLRDAPVTGGIVQRAAQEAVDDLRLAVDTRAAQFGSAVSKTDAGSAITQGVENFTTRVSQNGQRLYGALNRAMPPGTQVPATNTLNAVGSLNTLAQDMPGTASVLTPRLFERIREDLSNTGTVSFQNLSRVRTEVGMKLSDPALIDDIGRHDLKVLYGALSEDMRAAVAQNPNARQLFDIANNFWRQQMQFIDNSFAKLQRHGATPENIFNWATAEGKSGATRLAQLRRAMGAREFDNITAVVTRQLGRHGTDDGAFSPANFVTNWEKLSGDAKRVLYHDPAHREAMDRLVTISKDMQKTGALANTSRTAGTSQLFSWVTGIGQGAVGIGAGPIAMTGTIVAQVASQAALSKLLTSPGFVRWLATDVGPNGIGNHLKLLPQVAMREPQIAGEIEEFLRGVAAVGDE